MCVLEEGGWKDTNLIFDALGFWVEDRVGCGCFGGARQEVLEDESCCFEIWKISMLLLGYIELGISLRDRSGA